MFKPLSVRDIDPDFKEVWIYLIAAGPKTVKLELLNQQQHEMRSIETASLFFTSVKIPTNMKLLCYYFVTDGERRKLIKLENSSDLSNIFHTV